MSHQSQLEKTKYRNWVRGGLAYKYLKEGIERFADDVVQKEHTRVIGVVNNTSGNACNQCHLNTLKPIHTHVADPATGRKVCMWGQSNCKCLYPKTKSCPKKVCDVIMEEILKSHGSTPPSPNWKSTDVQKWYTSPWEIAKCFINAPGYSDKTSAADIDINGLLHVFINNTNLHSHLSCTMTGTNIFMKCRERRNKLFHSSAMEMEDAELTECIDDIIAILEDPKELASTANAQRSVSKLEQLQQHTFIITTHNEVEVCRDALAYINKKEAELQQFIQEANEDIDRKHADASKAIGDKIKTDLQDALEKNNTINVLKQSVDTLTQRVNNLEEDNCQIKMHLHEIDRSIDELEAVKSKQMKNLKYVEDKQALQDGLVTLYQRHYVKTSLSPLKHQDNDINIDEVYATPKIVFQTDRNQTGAGNRRFKKCKQQERYMNRNDDYFHSYYSRRPLNIYHNLFHLNGRENKAIYIVGDVGSGKSSFCKIMIQDWCKTRTCNTTNEAFDEPNCKCAYPYSFKVAHNKEEMRKFDFLFYIPLQKMSNYCKLTEMIQAFCTTGNLASIDLIERIFEQDSERCLIVIDGLDEWHPQPTGNIVLHESSGLPSKQGINNSTVITLSRPSAKGLLKIKSSEIDQKVELKGIRLWSIEYFIVNYLEKLNKIHIKSSLMEKIHISELRYLENSPLLLQQLVWLYCNDIDFGKSVSDIYCHLVNIMFGWSQAKTDVSDSEDDCCDKAEQHDQMTLPKALNSFPRCEENKKLLIQLAKVAFESLTSEAEKSSFSPTHLKKNGFSKSDISALIDVGILVKENSYDPTHETIHYAFIHMSYLEFFAAIYASCQFGNQPSDKTSFVLNELFRKCKTAAAILQLSNLLKMICGLCPFLITQVSHFISDIVKRDEQLTRCRHTDYLNFDSSILQIQQLIFSCLSLCDTDNKPMLHLADVYIDDSTEISALRSIVLDNVISLHAKNFLDEDVWIWITKLKQLQYLHITFSIIPHGQMTLLSYLIQDAPLRCLFLTTVQCKQINCREHSINISKCDRLQKLTIWDCEKIKISDINTEHLETVYIDTPTLDIGLLKTARSLNELRLGNDSMKWMSYSEPKYNRQVDSVVHTLHQLQTLTILVKVIDKNALTVIPEMRNLKHITMKDVIISLETWCTFVDSLLTLQQSVQVDKSFFPRCDLLEERIKYVREKEHLFEVIEDTSNELNLKRATLRFRTRKQ